MTEQIVGGCPVSITVIWRNHAHSAALQSLAGPSLVTPRSFNPEPTATAQSAIHALGHTPRYSPPQSGALCPDTLVVTPRLRRWLRVKRIGWDSSVHPLGNRPDAGHGLFSPGRPRCPSRSGYLMPSIPGQTPTHRRARPVRDRLSFTSRTEGARQSSPGLTSAAKTAPG